MKIDMRAISPSPILLFYWEDAAVAAHFSRRQNQAIQDVVKKHPDRFIGFGSVPLQSVAESIAIAREAQSMGLKGLEIGNAVGEKPLDDPSFEPFFQAAQELELLLFVHPLEGGLDADDPLSPVLCNVLQFTFRTTMMVERMILKGMFESTPICVSVYPWRRVMALTFGAGSFYTLRTAKQLPRKPSQYLKQMYLTPSSTRSRP
jgi:predicted TIM-barrel fold metal-dependent hydrolase